MTFIRSLSRNPHTPGDFFDLDETGRTRQIKVVGRYAVTYWVDEAVKTVMIVDVQQADR